MHRQPIGERLDQVRRLILHIIPRFLGNDRVGQTPEGIPCGRARDYSAAGSTEFVGDSLVADIFAAVSNDGCSVRWIVRRNLKTSSSSNLTTSLTSNR